MLERRARRHEKNGLATTTPGSCTVECPACSHPEKYMPDNWKDTPENKNAHFDLTTSLPRDLSLKWGTEFEAWEQDKANTNPFPPKVAKPTQALVRYELAQAEARNASTTEETSLDEHVLPSVLIACGLEIEGEQCGLKVEASKIWQHSQDRQRSKIQLRCNSLQRKIAAWSQINQLYIPAVTTLSRIEEQTTAAQKKPLHAYTISHWLPSQIGTKLSFDLHLAEIEWKLRVAQAYEALETLRSCLQIR
ncbi:hypothetical protein E4T56_gene16882 [Termitomyces sp. T112]|nr:hypothetical protein E4T56_gene16882 [Termitomyces sp. T112]